METVSGSEVTQEEEIDEPESDLLGDTEVPESDLVDKEPAPEFDAPVDISGNDSGAGGSASIPSGDAAITFPDEISLNNEQFEILMEKQEEIHESIQVQTCVTALLIGVLIGIIYVRGFSRFVRGV